MTEQKSFDPETDYRSLKTSEPSLPSNWYFDPDVYKNEMSRIFGREWLYVCHTSALPKPMSYRTMQIGDQPIFVVRDSDGQLKAFHNTCRHRGSILLQEESGQLTSKAIVCPYHQWSYHSADGRLVKTSSFSDPVNFEKSDYGLYPVAVREWRGCIMVNLDPDAKWDIEDIFFRTSGEIVNFPLETMVIGHVWRKVMGCNWKSFWENFNECLHCPNVHPELVDLVPLYGRRIVDRRDTPGWRDHEGDNDPKYRGGLREGADTWSMNGSAQGHILGTLSEDDKARGQTYTVSLPSMFIAAYADHIRIVRLMPVGPEETELVSEWLFTPETLASDDYDTANVIEFAKLVMTQDLEACELNQRGMHAAPFKQGVLMPEEYYLKEFQDWVRQTMEA